MGPVARGRKRGPFFLWDASGRQHISPAAYVCALLAWAVLSVALFLLASSGTHAASSRSSGLPRPLSRGSSLDLAAAVQRKDSAHAHLPGVEEQWAAFWQDDATRAALGTLQALREQTTHMRYQCLAKDVEPQDTAGLDLAAAGAQAQLAAQTGLLQKQAWLKEQVTGAVFAALNRLQHPCDCSAARKLVCNLEKGCGFGCELHHAVHCLAHAVALNRTMVLLTDSWRYARGQDGQAVWEALLAPVGSCGRKHLRQQQDWSPVTESDLRDGEAEVLLSPVDSGTTQFEPPAMPPDVLRLAGLFNSRPEVWWVGALASYILRPSAATRQALEQHKRRHAWRSPLVGVHIRRTDKIWAGEAKFHAADEYMRQAELYCDLHLPSGWARRGVQAPPEPSSQQLSGSSTSANSSSTSTDSSSTSTSANSSSSSSSSGATPACSVYLATDEPAVVDDIRQRYKHVRVITNPAGTATGEPDKRDSSEGAAGVVYDILLLAASDVLVGTFSSQVSRAAYEVSQVNRTSAAADASLDYHSVDSVWYMGGMLDYKWCATRDFTDAGSARVRAGEHLLCRAIHKYQRGFLECSSRASRGSTKVDDAHIVLVPPAILGRCQGSAVHGYRPLLPPFMRPPSQQAAAPDQGAAGQAAAAP